MSDLTALINKEWKEALERWGNPSLPNIITAKEEEEFAGLGKVGHTLREQLAFMQYPNFQTYANLHKIEKTFSDFERGYRTAVKHEVGHRFCPYDPVTAFFMAKKVEQALEKKKNFAGYVMNLFTDTCINTHLVRTGDKDLPWVYNELSKATERQTPLWRVYVGSLERIWNESLLPERDLPENERRAAEELASLFEQRNPLEKAWWEEGAPAYARVIAPFLEQEQQQQKQHGDSGSSTHQDGCPCSSGAESIPKEITEELQREIARRLAKPGADGLPTNPAAVKEFRDILAGLGEGNPSKASIAFYEHLASRYTIKFSTKPFGRPRSSPFSLKKWCPSDPIGDLSVQQSVLANGTLIPGVTTQQWRSRVTTIKGGEYECIPSLDILLDSSGSMPNPTETVSLPVLAGFVAARRAQKYGVRSLNYSQNCKEVTRTSDLAAIYANLALYQNGGTVFPVAQFLGNPVEDPRLSLIITDTFIANFDETTTAIRQFRQRHKDNRVTIYAITQLPNVDELRAAGAECIHNTTPNIFKHIVGKTERTYLQ